MAMSITFMDGFDWLPSSSTSAAARTKWNDGATTVSRVAGRYSDTQPSYGINCINLGYSFPAGAQHIVVGVAAKPGASNDAFRILGPTGTVQITVDWDGTANEWRVLRGTSTVLGTTNINGALGQWYHLDFAVYIHNTEGAAFLNVNGSSEISLTGIDTQADTTHHASAIGMGDSGGAGAGSPDMDDFYLKTTGTPDTTITDEMLGDTFIQTLWPASDSTVHADWTPSTGTDMFAVIDDADAGGGPDESDYIETDTDGNQYLVFLDAVDSSVIDSIKACQWNQLARYNDVGPDYLRALLRIGGTDYTGSTAHLLNSSYFTWRDIYETNPDTASAWVVADIDTTEWGGGKE